MATRKNKNNFGKAFMDTATEGAGLLGANALQNKLLPNMNPLIKGGVLFVSGLVGQAMVDPKMEMVANLAKGVCLSGLQKAAGSKIPALAGIDDDNMMMGIGYDDDPEDYSPDEPEDYSPDEPGDEDDNMTM